MTKHCIVLLSGGLDSLLALRLMTLQGIRATALHSINCFHGVRRIGEKKEKIRRAASALGAADVVFPDITADVVSLTKSPRHGYGKHLNACIDCRLRTVFAGFDALRELGADFVVSGEVVGQRPMSQRKDAINLANREVAKRGFPGLFLRPLCAKIVEETVPQREGWVDARYLYDISGRGRDRQMALAAELGISEYPTPAGGCLLTDPGFSAKLAVLMNFKPDWQASDIELLKVGRHFQIAPDVRIVASRNEEENYRLRDLTEPGDLYFINKEKNGAVVLLRGKDSPAARETAAGVAVYYSKMRDAESAPVEMWRIAAGVDAPEGECRAKAVHPDALRGIELNLAGADCLRRMRQRTA